MKVQFVKILCLATLLPLFGGLTPESSQAAAVRVVNLRNLMEHSDRIFVGRCLSVESKVINNIPFTEYIFEVVERIKGVSTDTVTVRQFGLIGPIPIGNGLARGPIIQGMPQYKENHQYLLFLVQESPIGLSSPAGLSQGAFLSTSKGFVNSINNRNLSQGLTGSWLQGRGLSGQQANRMIKFKKGPIEAKYFMQVLWRLTGTGRPQPQLPRK
jgi:hypothetical protein